jgi:hypothetical protein
MKRATRNTLIAVAVIVIVLAAAGIGSVMLFISRHVHTEYVGADVAEREFETARARFAGQTPLIAFHGTQATITHFSPCAPHQELTLHALAYGAGDRELRRADFPMSVLRLITAGGRFRLINLWTFGDERDRITLDALECHGPGLIVDVRGGNVGLMVVGNAALGTQAQDSRLLMWTESP